MSVFRPRSGVTFRHDFELAGKRDRATTRKRTLEKARQFEAALKERIREQSGLPPTRTVRQTPREELVYFVQIGYAVEIRRASSLRPRLSDLQTANPEPLALRGTDSVFAHLPRALLHRAIQPTQRDVEVERLVVFRLA